MKILAALVWYAGGFTLLVKGAGLLTEAAAIKPDENWPWTAAISGVLLGGIKAKYLFSKNCRRNLIRISTLVRPKIWQFFRPVFFLLLLLMILAGAALSRLAHGNYSLLLWTAALDLTIATALLGSSFVFWKKE